MDGYTEVTPTLAEVADLVARRTRYDERPALSEYKVRAMNGSVPAVALAFADADTPQRVAIYVQGALHPSVGVDVQGRWAIEVVLDPAVPPEAVVAALIVALERVPSDTPRFLWSWDPDQIAAVTGAGYATDRVLLQMKVDLVNGQDVEMPGGVTVEAFRPGHDENAWIELNNRAFAHHPENGSVTIEEMDGRMMLPWFDPDDLLMAWSDGVLVGSCWTKVHDRGVGEIYIIGVEPEWQGRGLGRALVQKGLRHLAVVRRCREAILYTEEINRSAVRLYESIGFTTNFSSVEFQLDG